MKVLKTSIAAWSASIAMAIFWVLNIFVSHAKMIEISSSLVLGVTFAVLLRWFRDAGRAMRTGRGGSDFLIVAVFSTMAILFMHRVYVIILTVHGRPDYLLDSPISAFLVWMLAWSCTMFLIAPDAEDGHIPPRSRVLIGLALFIAGLVSGITIALSLL